MEPPYLPTWNSLRTHPTSQWLKDAKFGIYTHWGVYSVPAHGPNGTWYPYFMYREGSPQYEYHLKTYGHPAKFGYKDFIPMFTAEKFDPDEWAEIFKNAGAKFAGPVGEHHDGFAMWDTRYSEWNAAKMGPRRDVVKELAQAIRKQGMRFLVALHHAENWWFFPHWRLEFDTSDPRYKPLSALVHYLVDNVSKNGYLLLNVGPRPDGVIPDEAKALLAGMGKWLAAHGEAIYGTTPWLVYGEGPTQMTKAGYFMEDQEVQYTAQDIRFTAKEDCLYAICLGCPREPFTIRSLRFLYPGEVRSIRCLGEDAPLQWSLGPDGLKIQPPLLEPGEPAYVFKIERGHPFKE